MSTPASNEIREQLQRICESDTFRSAPQVSRLLTFLVDATIEGNPPKELSIGASFFRRLPGYDSQADPVVRTEVRRLRLKLGEYYFKEGSGAPILIEIPSGGYKAKFTMREVAPAAAAPEVPAAAPLLIQTGAPVKPRARVPAKILAAAAAILLAGAGLWLLPRLTSRPAAARRSIAVFRLTDLAGAGDTAWLGTALSQLIAADLSANSALRIVSIADVVRTRLDLGLGDDTDSLAPSELSRIRRSLDADLVIAGSYASTGPAGSRQYRIDLRVYDARTGAASGAVSDTDVGDERTLFDLVSRVEARLGRQAGVEMAARQEQSDSGAQVGGARPAGLELARSLCLQADLLPYGSAGKESLYRKSLEAGRKEGPGPWQVDPLVGLAKIEAARRDFVKAADFYRQAYEVTLKYYGPDHGATAAAKIQWARSRMRTGEVREAIDQIKEAIPVARREFPPDSLRLWNILHDAVHACNDGKAFRQAESYTVEALAINERLRLPPTSERWGMLYWDLGRAKRGERNYRDAIAAFEKAEADFQQFTDTRAREVQEDIEQLKAEQRADAAPAK